MGSIPRVTKEVDMVFTRRFDISRMLVMVMNPNLISQSGNVVIGDHLYELKFRVEVASDASNPLPMDMDHNQGERGNDPRDNVEGGRKKEKPTLAHKGNAGGSRNSGSMNGKGGG
jgi:hypothetical protein